MANIHIDWEELLGPSSVDRCDVYFAASPSEVPARAVTKGKGEGEFSGVSNDELRREIARSRSVRTKFHGFLRDGGKDNCRRRAALEAEAPRRGLDAAAKAGNEDAGPAVKNEFTCGTILSGHQHRIHAIDPEETDNEKCQQNESCSAKRRKAEHQDSSLLYFQKNHPKHKYFRDRPPNNIDEMEVMFEKAYVTGNSSAIPGETTQEGWNVVDIDGLEDGVEAATVEADTNEDNGKKSKGPAKRRGASITLNPKKKRKNPMARDFKRMVDIMASGPAQIGPSIAEVMDIVIQAGVVEGSDEHFIATRLFIKQENREVFVTIKTDEGKINWLRRMFDLKMKKK